MCTYNAISSHTDHYEIQKKGFRRKSIDWKNAFVGILTFISMIDTTSESLEARSLYFLAFEL